MASSSINPLRPRKSGRKTARGGRRAVLITGAGRGLGLAVAKLLEARGMDLILTAREPERLRAAGFKNAVLMKLDVGDPADVARFCRDLKRRGLRVDVLINNAGHHREADSSAFAVDAAEVARTFQINAMGPFLLSQALLPLMIERGFGRILNVSSSMGLLRCMKGDKAAYRVSKAALNAVTMIFAERAASSGADVLVNAIHPGWVRTEMGGPRAPLPVAAGAEAVAAAALLPRSRKNGRLFFGSEVLPW
jgi:NAD(P)-dependent dehydrogenase (short-subunit alcohol dehydrogenase family)